MEVIFVKFDAFQWLTGVRSWSYFCQIWCIFNDLRGWEVEHNWNESCCMSACSIFINNTVSYTVVTQAHTHMNLVQCLAAISVTYANKMFFCEFSGGIFAQLLTQIILKYLKFYKNKLWRCRYFGKWSFVAVWCMLCKLSTDFFHTNANTKWEFQRQKYSISHLIERWQLASRLLPSQHMLWHNTWTMLKSFEQSIKYIFIL